MATELRDYILDHTEKPFDWSKNNCLSFASGALRVLGLPDLPRDWYTGAEDRREAVRAYRAGLERYGYANIIQALDDRYERVWTLHPEDGMICARKTDDLMGHGFGVTFRNGCVFLTADGAKWSDVEAGDKFWRAN